MRVDTGIILSVLSFSVFAAVIPNNDSHGPLLVRRTVSPENRAVLWKRNNDDDQMDSDDSDSGASGGTEPGTSGGDSSSNSPSISRGLSNSNQFRGTLRGLQLSLPKVFKGQKTGHTMQRDSKDIKKVITKLTQAVQGRQGKSAIDDIGMFFEVLLESAKLLKNVYDDKANTPFASSPQKFSSSKPLAKELNRIKSTAKRLVKHYLKEIYKAIAQYHQTPPRCD
ncbi:hypothetical protein BASA50_009212 [Batrachochytrium salamandrivorans]|uniref:Uncharacterized protein n=1 Tax=Batrachochytrium salamandrivorans TaxID=1357716 RepID=A0ABQ8F1Z0_9FUNG|nr:hypothetical protein BASA50_009212 [Batrachochytrium salamandrivorans]